jgi:5-methylcytosine-specific restriction endonuclease McrBC GTP-binding regulatory subunit McrB
MDSMIKKLIEAYGQVILYGPPGTGKTHLAKSIGQLDRNSEVKFVTFHKSYSYEDFVEGYRPDTNREGSIIYRVHDGIFKKFAFCKTKIMP